MEESKIAQKLEKTVSSNFLLERHQGVVFTNDRNDEKDEVPDVPVVE